MRKSLFKDRPIYQWILFGFTIFSVILLLTSYVAYYLSPEGSLSYFAFFGLAYPVILLLNILFMLIWLFLWKRFFWIPFLAILIGFNHLSALIQFDLNPEKVASGSIKIMTFNVHNLMGAETGKKDRTTPAKVRVFLNIEKPEILCFQEFRIRTSDTTKYFEELKENSGLNHFYFQNYYSKMVNSRINGLATFSKHPMIGKGELKLPNSHVFAIYTDFLVDDERFRVYNIHLESIRFAMDDYSFYSNLSEPNNDKLDYKKGAAKIFEKLRKAFIKRREQVKILERSMKESPYPIVVCGDFNDTPSSYTYNALTNNLHDSFREAGGGFLSPTYAGDFPSFRIDYILFDEGFKAYEYKRHTVNLSDHYPISVYLNITPAE